MNVRVKNAALITMVLILMNSMGPSSNNTRKKGGEAISVVYNKNESIQYPDNGGPDYEGDSIAVLNTRTQIRKKLVFKANDTTLMNRFGYKYYVQKALNSRESINFGQSDDYSILKGVTAFRGNNMRDGGSYGAADIKEEKFVKLWEKSIGSIDSWSGVGWNGQPAIVQWDPEILKNMNIIDDKKSSPELKEVIYATLDGNIYFLDLEDGKPTREKLSIGAPVKGSLTVDPRGLPLLYAGQGIDTSGSKYVDFAYRIFSLIDFKKLYEIKGKDNFARRSWGAFDSTALIDRFKDYFFLCGENGIVYSGKLNTKYENGKISMEPKIDKYRYDAVGRERRGIENSMAIYENYGFFSDNDGLLQCLDLNTLTPVWTQEVNDDTDSTVVLEKNLRGLYLYTANEVDHQGSGGYSYVRKIDATDGSILWQNKYQCAYDSNTNGGALATPIVGKNDISNIVIFNIARTPEYGSGYLLALDKESGKEVWKLKLSNYCWSSPIALYNSEGKSYIVQSDSSGKTFLIEGVSGKILDTINLGSNVEGTPAAFGSKIVVGTRGCKIVAFEVR